MGFFFKISLVFFIFLFSSGCRDKSTDKSVDPGSNRDSVYILEAEPDAGPDAESGLNSDDGPDINPADIIKSVDIIKPDSKKIYKAGVLYWSRTISGQLAMSRGLEEEALKINRTARAQGGYLIDLDIKAAGDGISGIENQIHQMNQMISDKKDIIIVQPTDIAALGPVLKKANKQGIPVVAYDQHIIGGDLACFVTSDNYQAGYLDGEYVAHCFEDTRNLRIILVEYPHVSSTVSRVDGFIDAIEEMNQPFSIIKTYLAVDPESGRKAAKEILSDFPEKNSFDVIFSVNDGGGYEIVKALEKAGRKEIFFASVDGDPRAIERIKNNDTILKIDSAQFCQDLGAETMRAAYMVLEGRKVGKKILIPVFPVTSHTLHLYQGWTSPKPGPFKKIWSSLNPEWTGQVKHID
jgi:ribose transport system substrate-binding protein